MRRRSAALMVLSSLLAPLVHAKPGSSGGVAWFEGDLLRAMAAGREQQKVVLLDAWAAWCRYCHQMDRDVWSRPDVARAVSSAAIPIHPEVDISAGSGLDLAGRYDISSLPMTLFIDPRDGKVLRRLEGYADAQTVLRTLDAARGQLLQEMRSDPGPGSVDALVADGGRLLRAGDIEAARRAALKAKGMDPTCQHDKADEAGLLLADIEEYAGQLAKALSDLRAIADPCLSASSAAEIWKRIVVLSAKTGGPSARGKALISRAEHFPSDPEAQREAAEYLVASGERLEAAERMAKRAIELAPEDTQSMSLLANIALTHHQSDVALQWIDKAIRIDPQDPALRELRLKIVMNARREGGS